MVGGESRTFKEVKRRESAALDVIVVEFLRNRGQVMPKGH